MPSNSSSIHHNIDLNKCRHKSTYRECHVGGRLNNVQSEGERGWRIYFEIGCDDFVAGMRRACCRDFALLNHILYAVPLCSGTLFVLFLWIEFVLMDRLIDTLSNRWLCTAVVFAVSP